ncbi:MAG: RnfABCDGE type electron transport complex subunit D [Clostridiales bacterium]|nr:RnfABCDGE type electron transport complex subunit D [Clostridiales bacterium]
MEQKLTVSSSPHIKLQEDTASIMLDVIIALIPATAAGIYYFGMRALAVILTSVAACMLSEYTYEKITGKPITTRDLSAVVTGLLLSLNLPVTIPLWITVIGAAFAIIIVKQLYGGLGKNFMNPALAARCFMLIAWAGSMTNFVQPFMGYGADAVSSATPLAVLKGTSEGTLPTLLTAFLGGKPGCIGEVSGLMLIIGFLYLLVKRVADWKIPVCYIATFAVLTYLFGNNTTGMSREYFTAMHILTGGLLLGAFFMATDYVTSPATASGRVIFGIGCGLLTFAIRRFGSYPEGVSFSIILMNVASPLIERYTVPKPFGKAVKP